MDKPISIIIEETKNSIVQIINKSKLHPSIIEIMLKGIYLETNILSNEILQKEKALYYDGNKTNEEIKEPANM